MARPSTGFEPLVLNKYHDQLQLIAYRHKHVPNNCSKNSSSEGVRQNWSLISTLITAWFSFISGCPDRLMIERPDKLN